MDWGILYSDKAALFWLTFLGGALGLISLALLFILRGRDKKKDHWRDEVLVILAKKMGIEFVDGLPKAPPQARDLFRNGLLAWDEKRYDEGIKYLSESISHTENASQRCAVHVALGELYLDIEDYLSARKEFSAALLLARETEDEKGKIWALNGLGLTERKLENLEQALMYHVEGLKIAEVIKYDGAKAAHLAYMGQIYADRADFETALVFYCDALPLHEAVNNPEGEIWVLDRIAPILMNKKNFNGALVALRKARVLARRVNDPLGNAEYTQKLGIVLFRKGDFAGALRAFKSALRIFRKHGEVLGEINQLCNIGSIYLKRKEYDRALKQYEEALAKAETVGAEKEIAIIRINMNLAKNRG